MSGHGIGLEIIERGPNNEWQTWLGTCACKAKWTADTYEATEDKWRQHVHATTGTAPRPMGSKERRWTP